MADAYFTPAVVEITVIALACQVWLGLLARSQTKINGDLSMVELHKKQARPMPHLNLIILRP